MTTPFEQGYRAFKSYGMTARNPFAPVTQTEQNYQWARGFEKARLEDAKR